MTFLYIETIIRTDLLSILKKKIHFFIIFWEQMYVPYWYPCNNYNGNMKLLSKILNINENIKSLIKIFNINGKNKVIDSNFEY
jgi:hypothetical protein